MHWGFRVDLRHILRGWVGGSIDRNRLEQDDLGKSLLFSHVRPNDIFTITSTYICYITVRPTVGFHRLALVAIFVASGTSVSMLFLADHEMNFWVVYDSYLSFVHFGFRQHETLDSRQSCFMWHQYWMVFWLLYEYLPSNDTSDRSNRHTPLMI